MKYGKQFQQLLDASDFPDDWKTSAIEYRKLKKLIKNVVTELETMGLPPSVLHRLLVTDSGGTGTGTNGSSVDTPTSQEAAGGSGTPMSEEEDVFEFEFEVPESAVAAAPSASPKEVVVDPVFEEDEARDGVGTGPSSSSLPASLGKEHTHRFRLRTVTPPTHEGESPRPLGVTEMLRTRSGSGYASPPVPILPPSSHERTASPAGNGTPESRLIVHRAGTDNASVTAEYVLAGDEENPVPQIRLHVANFETGPVRHSWTPTETTSTNTPTSSHLDLATDTDDEDDDYEDSSRERRLGDDLDNGNLPPVPPSPSLLKCRTAASPIWAIATAGNTDGLAELSLGDAAELGDADEDEDIIELRTPTMSPTPPDDATPTVSLTAAATDLHTRAMVQSSGHIPSSGAHSDSTAVVPAAHDRQFIIPLQSDMAFFNVLTAALKSLSEFHAEQQDQFHKAVNALCKMVSQSIQPGDAPIVMPAPLNSGAAVPHVEYSPSMNMSQKDLYAWREIFSLWVESQIFESNAERDRGERTVAEAERRLKVFANEVVKRGLGDRRTLKGKRSRKAWDEFLRLNVLLLDLKRFQMANINAARKILKKHDKRTALTASTGLASFVRTTLTAHVDKDGNVSTWTFYNTSLPHVLLANLTETLLPILPSLDDYACLICMSIAFKPIRLSCGHVFCVRCLVKMQQRRKEQCPLCRSESVLLADKTCLDTQLMNFMKDWFPKEVKDKQKENTAEIAKEQLQDAGLDPRCVIM